MMEYKFRWMVFGILFFALFGCLNCLSSSEACTGAKRMAMGGAGITVEGDPHVVYWNPAALTLLGEPEISYSRLFGKNASLFRYDNVLTFGMPLKDSFGIGGQFIKSEMNKKMFGEDMTRFTLAGGTRFFENDDDWQIMVGAEVTLEERAYTGAYGNFSKNTKEYGVSFLAKKQGIFSSNDVLRFGYLLRVREITASGDRVDESRSVNFRPGLSYTVPNRLGDLTVAVSFYKFNGLFKEKKPWSAGLRIGAEQIIHEKLALRAGFDDVGEGCWTAGIGYKISEKLQINTMYNGSKYGIIELSFKF